MVGHGGHTPVLRPRMSLLSAPFQSLLPCVDAFVGQVPGSALLFHSGVSVLLLHLSPSWLHVCANPAPGLRAMVACRQDVSPKCPTNSHVVSSWHFQCWIDEVILEPNWQVLVGFLFACLFCVNFV